MKLDSTKISLIIALILLAFAGGWVIHQQIKLAEERGRNQALLEHIDPSMRGKTNPINYQQNSSPINNRVNTANSQNNSPAGQISEEDSAPYSGDESLSAIEQKILNMENPTEEPKNLAVEEEAIVSNIKNKGKIANAGGNLFNDQNARKAQETKQLSRLAQRIKNMPPVAKVNEANQKYGFIVLDLGKNGNLKIGDKFGVKRDADFICVIEITSIEDKQSIASVIPKSRIDNRFPAKGDYIIYPPPY